MWTKEFPAEAGWYWWKKKAKRANPIVVEVCKFKVGKFTCFDVEIDGEVFTAEDATGYFYSEPIKEPLANEK